jgi:23S rRNA pseudouridine2605 synthase
MAIEMRLQKYLAEQGYCSRREADALVLQGRVRVNGHVAEPGQRIRSGEDTVKVGNRVVRPRNIADLTLAINKPTGLICSHRDPHNLQTVYDLLPKSLRKHRLLCAGRLDKDSEGLVILTSDGDLANRLMHPSGLIEKRYRVTLTKPFPADRIRLLCRGVNVDGELLKVEQARVTGSAEMVSSPDVEIRMHHGKNREIRRLFSTLGYTVKRLRRYQVGSFSLRGFPLRGVKVLSMKEINQLLCIDQKIEVSGQDRPL